MVISIPAWASCSSHASFVAVHESGCGHDSDVAGTLLSGGYRVESGPSTTFNSQIAPAIIISLAVDVLDFTFRKFAGRAAVAVAIVAIGEARVVGG
jgi:hypothetical protein